MTFNHPQILFALFALLIPVVIHLFNFRRYKKVLFSNIEFLKNIKSETKKQNELKHLLVLLFRMLAFAFIVLAFAGPEFNSAGKNVEKTGPSTKIIYLDNSFSMSAQDENARLLDVVVENARKLIELSAPDTRFVLLTNSGNSGKRILSKEAILNEIEQVRLVPAVRSLSNLLRSEQKISVDRQFSNREVFSFSDFQKSSVNFTELVFDTAAFYYLIASKQSQKRNIYLDSCAITSPFLIPGKNIEMLITIKNGSDQDYEKVPLKLIIDGKQKGAVAIDLKSGQEEIVPITFISGEKGWHEGVVTIEDSPVTFDNQLYFAYNVKEKIRVIELNDGQTLNLLRKLYESDSIFYFSKINYKKVDVNVLQKADLIILNGLPEFSNGLVVQLKEFANNGGNLFLLPGDDDSSDAENIFLRAFEAGEFTLLDKTKTKVIRINQQDELFKNAIEKIPENADLPIVNEHFKLKYPVNSGITPLVTLINGDVFLAKKNFGNGQLYVLTAPLEKKYSNFSTHPIFIPTMYGSTFSNQSVNRLFYTIGINNNLTTNISSDKSGETPFRIQKTSTDFSFIPEQQFISGRLNIDFYNNIEEDGIYSLMLNDSLYELYGFNYNRVESKMDFYSSEDIEIEMEKLGIENYKILGSSFSTTYNLNEVVQKESDLWKLFVILALVMLLAEIVVLRYWK